MKSIRNISIDWADSFLFALTDPRAMLRNIERSRKRQFAFSFAVPIFYTLSEILSSSLLEEQSAFFSYKITYGWILSCIILIFVTVFASSVRDFISQVMGYQGNTMTLITVINYAMFPKIFLLPAVYVFYTIGFAPIFFYYFFALGLYVWSVLIAVLAISEMNQAGGGKSAVIYFAPGFITGIIVFFCVILASVGVFTWIAG